MAAPLAVGGLVHRWILGQLVDRWLGEAVNDVRSAGASSCRSQIEAATKEVAVNTLDRLLSDGALHWRWDVAIGRAFWAWVETVRYRRNREANKDKEKAVVIEMTIAGIRQCCHTGQPVLILKEASGCHASD